MEELIARTIIKNVIVFYKVYSYYRFSRLIVGMQMDHNLNDSLFQLYATSSTRGKICIITAVHAIIISGVGSLAQHDATPDITAEPVIVTMADNETAVVTVDDFPRRQLTKVHGYKPIH